MPKNSCLADVRVDDRRIWELKKSKPFLKKESSIEELAEEEFLRHDLSEFFKKEQQLSIEQTINNQKYLLWFKRICNLEKKSYSWFYIAGPKNNIMFKENVLQKYMQIEERIASELEQELNNYNKIYSGNKINF